MQIKDKKRSRKFWDQSNNGILGFSPLRASAVETNVTLRNAILALAMLATATAGLSAQQPRPERDPNQKVIRDPAEYNAYVSAMNVKDPTGRATAMIAFARDYPKSVVYVDALEQAMAAYQQAGMEGMVLHTGRRILETQPDNMRALALVVAIDRVAATNNGPNADPAMREVCSYAPKGLEELPRWPKPEGMTEADFGKLSGQIMNIFAGAAGFCALRGKDYVHAHRYYQRALRVDPTSLENTSELSVADLEMDPLDPNGFWYCGKAIHMAERYGKLQVANSMTTYCKAKYKRYYGGEDGWDGLLARTTTETAPPSVPPANKQPTPAELAVQALQQNDPANLSFSDWEIVLQYRDVSPANKEAAEKVWKHIQDQQKNGQDKLKFPIKVISATQDTIHAAVTPDNQAANQEDLQIAMEKPMAHPPAAGATIDIVGVIQSYTPNPFRFLMVQGDLWPPPAKTQLSEDDIEKLLLGGVTSKRVTELVKQKGVDFTLDDAIELRLRKAGAKDELLLAIATGRKQ